MSRSYGQPEPVVRSIEDFPAKHLFYLDRSSYPIALSTKEPYAVLGTEVERIDDTYVFHHLVKPARKFREGV